MNRRQWLIFLLKRLAVMVATLFFGMSLVFVLLYAGPLNPAESLTGVGVSGERVQQAREQFGLTAPLTAQYVDFMVHRFTLDVGQSWTIVPPEYNPQPGPGRLHFGVRLLRTLWLVVWALVVAYAVGIPIGMHAARNPDSWSERLASSGGIIARALPPFLFITLFQAVRPATGDLLFGFGWGTFLVETPLYGSLPRLQIAAVTEPQGFLRAVKRVLPAAVGTGLFLLGTTMHIGRTAMLETITDGTQPPTGIREHLSVWHSIVRNAIPTQVAVMRTQAGVLILAIFLGDYSLGGIYPLFFEATQQVDLPVLGSIMFVFIGFIAVVSAVQGILSVFCDEEDSSTDERRSTAGWTVLVSTVAVLGRPMDRLRDRASAHRTHPSDTNADSRLRRRFRREPWPAVVWVLGVLVLVAVELGALAGALAGVLPGPASNVVAVLADLPTLLSRELISNSGYWTPDGGWVGTFLGVEPAIAWALRAGLVYLYALAWLGWLWVGYLLYRSVYRGSHWMPTDAALHRLRTHRWGRFGLVVVFVFVVAGVFAPTLGPAPGPTAYTDEAIAEYENQTVTYFNEETGMVATIRAEIANTYSESLGTPTRNVGPLSYDKYGRFHPFGTTAGGTDLLTEMLYGARAYLFIGAVAFVMTVLIVAVLAMLTAAFGRMADRVAGVVTELTAGLPVIPLLILCGLVFFRTEAISTYIGGVVLFGALFGMFFWLDLWQTIRTLALEADNCNQGDGKTRGQRLSAGINLHTLRAVSGPLCVYSALSMTGIVMVTTAVAMYISRPPFFTWEVDADLLLTVSWHIGAIPLGAFVLVLIGFNSLAAGIRDAIDPPSEGETSDSTADESVSVSDSVRSTETVAGHRSRIAWFHRPTGGETVTAVRSSLRTAIAAIRTATERAHGYWSVRSNESRGEE